MEFLARFRQIAETPLRDWNKQFRGHRPVGVYNAYFPQELLHAAGFTPVYLFHQPSDYGNTRTHLPSFTCWPGKSLVDQALSGELDCLHAFAFAGTCDTVQALTDILSAATPEKQVFHFGMPTNLTSPSTRTYLIAELQHLWQKLGAPSNESLAEAWAVYDRTRVLAEALYRRSTYLKPTEFHAVLKACHLMPKTVYNQLMARFVAGLEEVEFLGPRLFMVGPHLSDVSVYLAIEEAGARIAGDLLDVGQRYFDRSGPYASAAAAANPIGAIADRLLAATPTPTKYHAARRRDQLLVERVENTQADGVVFSRQAFCDPHGFDFAHCARALDAREIPYLFVELDQTSQTGQLQTRVEAFLETMAK